MNDSFLAENRVIPAPQALLTFRAPIFVAGALAFLAALGLSVPARAGQSGIALARSPQGVLATVWEERNGSERAIWLSRRAADGSLIGFPVKVNDAAISPGAVGRGPKVAANAKGHVVVLWQPASQAGQPASQAGSEQKPAPLRVSFSPDGRRFRPSRPLPLPAGAGAQDLGDVALSPDDTVHVVWLQTMGKAVQLRTARAAGSGAFGPSRVLDHLVCECCQTALAVGPDGETVLVAYRDNVENLRDIKAVVSEDGGKTYSAPRPVGADGWKLAACPMQGPSATVGPRGERAVAWSESASGEARAHVAVENAGKFRTLDAFSPPPPATHPLVRYSDDGTLWLVWEDGVGAPWAEPSATARIRYTFLPPGPTGVFAPAQTVSLGAVHFPALVAMGQGAPLAGWVESRGPRGSDSVVRTGALAKTAPFAPSPAPPAQAAVPSPAPPAPAAVPSPAPPAPASTVSPSPSSTTPLPPPKTSTTPLPSKDS